MCIRDRFEPFILDGFVGWFVDPCRRRNGQDLWCLVRAESFWEACACRVQRSRPCHGLRFCEAEMDVRRRVEADSGMAMFVVVSVDEGGHERLRVGEGAEAFGERWREFQ